MDKCNEFLDSECSVTHNDLKVDVLEPSSVSCVSDKIDSLDKTIEDKNRNITLITSKAKLVLEDKQIPTSSAKEKPNVIGLHVGPNGLINGLEIENSANLSHFFANIPKSEIREPLCTPSSSHITQKLSSGRNSLDSSGKKIVERTDSTKAHSEQECSSVSGCGGAVDTDNLDESSSKSDGKTNEESEVQYVSYESELQMPDIMRLIQKDLSEPYSIYTYRYFIHNWPKLCFLVSFI